MNEPTPLDKAEAAVAEASRNTDVVQLALAAVEVAKIAAASGQQQGHHCDHHGPKPEFNAKKWWTIGGLAIVGGCVVSALAMAFAVAAIAVAIAAPCAACALLVLRSMWRDYLNTR